MTTVEELLFERQVSTVMEIAQLHSWTFERVEHRVSVFPYAQGMATYTSWKWTVKIFRRSRRRSIGAIPRRGTWIASLTLLNRTATSTVPAEYARPGTGSRPRLEDLIRSGSG